VILRVKKETEEYIRGERNATRDEFILSREKAGNAERIYISVIGNDDQDIVRIYETWAKKCRRIPVSNPDIADIPQKSPTPKHTGGKRPYIMVMQDRSIDDISIEARGFLFTVFCKNNIEWHTGRLINRRSKKPLTIAAIAKEFNLKSDCLRKILRELKKAGILSYNNRAKAYFINQDFAKKGVPKK
jgi:hypothetical protein